MTSIVSKILNNTKKIEEAKSHAKLVEEGNVDAVIKELIDTDWSGSNEEQMKAVQLLKGLATSDDPKANKFMKALDSATSDMKMGEEEEEKEDDKKDGDEYKKEEEDDSKEDDKKSDDSKEEEEEKEDDKKEEEDDSKEDDKKDEKLSPKELKRYKMALAHATDMLGKAKVRAKDGSSDEKDNLEFWKDRVISITKKLKEGSINDMGELPKGDK